MARFRADVAWRAAGGLGRNQPSNSGRPPGWRGGGNGNAGTGRATARRVRVPVGRLDRGSGLRSEPVAERLAWPQPEAGRRAGIVDDPRLIERTLDLPTRDSRSEPDAEADEPRDGHPQPGNRPVGEALAELEPFAKSVAQCRYFAQPVAGPVADP